MSQLQLKKISIRILSAGKKWLWRVHHKILVVIGS